jgi:hypothetical protein
MTFTTYDMIGLEEAEKKRGLLSFSLRPEECKIEFTTTEPKSKQGSKPTLIHDRGRKRKEKGQLF